MIPLKITPYTTGQIILLHALYNMGYTPNSSGYESTLKTAWKIH